ncbi:flagellar hook-basal body complex protein [Lacticigenium naphthae]|uniref:flagellar hook-basal body complex protein n=1 Tax=Lacticigenium naphthae TaxID=515351 RepID=UPI0003F69F31|nr:flagellar hook-basal body complex protein [Lacticigenium naphthae]
MIRSMDVLARNFNVLQEKQKTISVNAANATTPGYKAQRLIQSTTAAEDLHNYMGGRELEGRRQLGGFTFGNQLDEMIRSFDPGALQSTGTVTAVGLQGEGFFTLQGENGQQLFTRNGDFTVDEQNQLVTQNGELVLATNGGAITVDERLTIDTKGRILETGQQLLITRFEDVNQLDSVGETTFTGQGGIQDTAQVSVYQGFLETSNLDMADAMVDLMQVTREFEANQKVLSAANDTLKKATNELGRV